MPPESTPQPPVTPQPPAYPPSGPPATQPDYGFIMEPSKPSRGSLFANLPGAESKPLRIAYITGGLLLLMILFLIIKGLFGGSKDYLTYFFNTAQDQQAIILLAQAAGQQQGVAVSTQNFAATAQLVLGSSQTATFQYMTKNGQKPNLKKLGLKIDASADQQLQSALAAATYDQTFRGIVDKKLTAYRNDISTAYQHTKGPRGRALLTDEDDQAKLLQLQLNGPTQ